MPATPTRAKEYLSQRTRAYRTTFVLSEFDNRVVLEDLAKFCRAHTPTYHKDARISERLEGRREVWLRIQQHLNMPDEQLWKLFGNPTLTDQGG